MRQHIPALLVTAQLVLASQTVFSVHDDLLAFPQYEVIFSDSFVSDTEASVIIEASSSTSPSAPYSSNSKSIDSKTKAQPPPTSNLDTAFDPNHETYELMYLNGEQHLCTIPIVDIPPKNETSEAEAKAAEQKELARATDRGWELLQDLEGKCLYFVSGWWSYSFCYNAEITQFHQLPPQPGKPPQRDPETMQYILGRARIKTSKGSEWNNEVDVHTKNRSPPKTELQIKGDTRYLMQKMEGGTTCDLTGKPRRIEIQYHCNPHLTDRIGYIKEITTCSYLMVVYTPRLCNDIAFLPPKDHKAHAITCRAIVPSEDLEYRNALKTLESALQPPQSADPRPQIGGLVVGAGKWVNKEGARMPIPSSFGKDAQDGRTTEVIAKAKSRADGGQVESVSDAELLKLDLDPEVVQGLREEVQRMAKEKGWKIEVVDAPGEIREILGIVDDGEEEDVGKGDGEAKGKGGKENEKGSKEKNDKAESEEGSEEVYKDEL